MTQKFTPRACTAIAYVCPMQSSDGLHFINGENATPEEAAKWIAAGYYRARVVAIEVQDESAT